MKLVSSKKFYLVTVSILLLLLLVLPLKNHFLNVEASPNEYQIRMLEITESGESDLTALKSGLANLTVDTMSMKRFVALRDDLDGRYDAVYIGRGTYNPAQVSNQVNASPENRAKALNTTAVKNDITELKAKQIKEEFIDKGLMVIFNTQPFSNQLQMEQSNLYKFFNGYKSTSTSNVKFVDNAGLEAIIKDLKSSNSTYISLLQQRPRLHITNRNQIIDYDPSNSNQKVYKPGDKLTFDFNITNASNLQNSPISAKLYIGLDSSLTMGPQQVVAETELNTASGTLEYTLPRTYSGVLYWKLEINDYHSVAQLKDYKSGAIRYRGEKTIVNVLQIITDSGVDSSLLNPSYMKPQLLESDDYKLNITVKSMKEFNSYVEQKYAQTQKYGLNGTYDMLIFGFQDEYYKKANLSTTATAAVTEFISKFKQSVLFTHDTVINLDPNNKNWVNHFKAITGQIDPETNLGHYASNLSTKVKPVNDGLLMQYPNFLSKRDDSNNQVSISTPQIAPTHNQYFTLDLNDPEVISWYNIESEPSGSKIKENETEYNQYQRDTEDSWNQYYTYSKGNVTYSGTGHFFGVSNIKPEQMNFPVWEQQLFVNTMYRAFMGANHAPEITVHTPNSGASIPSYQKTLLIDYTVTDLDLNDRDLITEIRFKQGNTYISNTGMSKKAIKSGQSIHETLPNPLPNGGTLDIEINAWDSHGALSTRTVTVNIVKSTPNLEVTRSLSSNVLNGMVSKGEAVTIDYSITPKPVPFDKVSAANQAYSKQVISNLMFEEKLPPNLEIAGALPPDMIKSGNLTEGYTLTRNLKDIPYSFKTEDGKKIFKPDSEQPIKFQITLNPTQTGTYTLNNSSLSYVDIHPNSPLGLAGGYNAFILGTTTLAGGGIEGTLASGGTVDFQSYGGTVNEKYKDKVPYAIVTGGDISFPEGTIYGNVLYKGTLKNQLHGSVQNGTPVKGELIDFGSQANYLSNLSAALDKLSANGIAHNDTYGKLTLTGHSSINIFDVSVTDLNSFNSSEIKVPEGSTIIINVKQDDKIEPFLHVPVGTNGQLVLFNFPKATSLRIDNSNVYGTILAPQADIRFPGGQVYGTIIGKSLNKSNSALFYYPFMGELPLEVFPTPSPTPPTNLGRTTISFETLSFTAEYKIKGLSLESKTIYVGDEVRLIPTVTPSDLSHSVFHWTSSNPLIVQIDASSGDIKGLSKGTSEITVRALDGSVIIAKATITVEERTSRSLTINGKESGIIKESIPLNAIYNQSNQGSETNLEYTWTVRNADPSGTGTATISPNPAFADDVSKVHFSADKSGTYIVKLTLTSSHPTPLTVEKLITISNPLSSLAINGPTTVMVGEAIDLSAIKGPVDADAASLIWGFVQSNGDAFATLVPSEDGSTAKLIAKGTAKDGLQIVVSSNGVTSSVHTVNIVDLTGLRFSNQSKSMYVGDTFQLRSMLWAFPNSISIDQIKDKLSWESNSPNIVSVNNGADVDSRGIVTALKKGSAIVTVTYNSGLSGRPSVKGYISIEVLERPNGDRY